MLLTKRSSLLLIPMLLLLIVPAVARNAKQLNQTEFTISEPSKIADLQLPKGSFLLKWESEGQGAHITVLQKNKVVGTVVGTVTDTPNHAHEATVFLRTEADGNRYINRIEAPQKSIVFATSTATTATGR